MKHLPPIAVTINDPFGAPRAATLWIDDSDKPLRWGGTLLPSTPGTELSPPRPARL